jgi:hypothetical protein
VDASTFAGYCRRPLLLCAVVEQIPNALRPKPYCLLQTKLEEMGVDFQSKPGERTGMQVLPIGPTAHQVCVKHALKR